MAWTYSGDPAASDLDQVRFRIGDTDTDDQQLQDAEINWAIAEETDLDLAAATSALAIAAKYARLADKEVGDLQIQYSQRQKHYQDLAKGLSADAAITNATPYAGGQSISDKQIDEDDVDNVKPAFQKGQFDYPENKDETVRTQDPD